MVTQPPCAKSKRYRDSEGKHWFRFPQEQIAAVIEIAGPIVKEYDIEPTRMIAHADIAPGRKQDPDLLFPWYTLACDENGAWPREAIVEYYEKRLKERALTVEQQQGALKEYGYDFLKTGVVDQRTKNTIASFQMHFAPTDYLGKVDDKTNAVLCALVEAYCPRPRDTILGTQLPSSGISGPAVNSKHFLESIASGLVDGAAPFTAATASKEQLFKPSELSQLFNLTQRLRAGSQAAL